MLNVPVRMICLYEKKIKYTTRPEPLRRQSCYQTLSEPFSAVVKSAKDNLLVLYKFAYQFNTIFDLAFMNKLK
jgi:hypothetical protein